jgi:hypothetical protein
MSPPCTGESIQLSSFVSSVFNIIPTLGEQKCHTPTCSFWNMPGHGSLGEGIYASSGIEMHISCFCLIQKQCPILARSSPNEYSSCTSHVPHWVRPHTSSGMETLKAWLQLRIVRQRKTATKLETSLHSTVNLDFPIISFVN